MKSQGDCPKQEMQCPVYKTKLGMFEGEKEGKSGFRWGSKGPPGQISRDREWKQEAAAVVQARNNGGLD